MELMGLQQVAYCVIVEFRIKGLEKEYSFVDNPVPVDVIRNYDGTYDAIIPSLIDGRIVKLTKEKYGEEGWILANGGLDIYVICDEFEKPIYDIFTRLGLPPKETFVANCKLHLKGAEELQDFELCSIIKNLIDDAERGEMNMRF